MYRRTQEYAERWRSATAIGIIRRTNSRTSSFDTKGRASIRPPQLGPTGPLRRYLAIGGRIGEGPGSTRRVHSLASPSLTVAGKNPMISLGRSALRAPTPRWSSSYTRAPKPILEVLDIRSCQVQPRSHALPFPSNSKSFRRCPASRSRPQAIARPRNNLPKRSACAPAAVRSGSCISVDPAPS